MEKYLRSAYYVNFDDETIKRFARKHSAEGASDIERAVSLYYAVRDGILYNPYIVTLDRKDYIAAAILAKGEGFCVQKAILLAAAGRAVGIPSRPGFANVINHLTTKKLHDILKSDLFVFHGYTEFHLNGKWVKATPAFNLSLCEKFGVLPLEFNGLEDSIFHPFNIEGKKHMEYVHDYGAFEDFPFEMMIEESLKYYPHLKEFLSGGNTPQKGNFELEAEQEKKNASR